MKKSVIVFLLPICLFCSSCSYLILGSWGKDPKELIGKNRSVIQKEFGATTETFEIGSLSANKYAAPGCWENEELANGWAALDSMTLCMTEILGTPSSLIYKVADCFNDNEIVLVFDRSEKVVDYKWPLVTPYVRLKKTTHGGSIFSNDSEKILHSECAQKLFDKQSGAYRKVRDQFVTYVQNGNTEALRQMISPETLRNLDFSALQNTLKSRFSGAIEYLDGGIGLAEDEYGNFGVYFICAVFKSRTTGNIQKEGRLRCCGYIQISVFEENGRLMVASIATSDKF